MVTLRAANLIKEAYGRAAVFKERWAASMTAPDLFSRARYWCLQLSLKSAYAAHCQWAC
jgi:hypothetical protein